MGISMGTCNGVQYAKAPGYKNDWNIKVERSVDGHIDLNNSLQSTLRASHSWSYWVKLVEGYETPQITQIGSRADNNNFYKILQMGGGGGELQIQFAGNSDFASYSTDEDFFPDGETGWIHVGVTVANLGGTNNTQFVIYKNGIAVEGSIDSSSEITGVRQSGYTNSNTIMVGNYNNAGTVFSGDGMEGSIDEIVLYSYVLSQSDMLELYNNGDPGEANELINTGTEFEPGKVVRYFRMLEGTGITLEDSSSAKGENATLRNATWEAADY